MIIGIGTDIVKISRLEKSRQRFGDRFASRILADAEFEQYQRTEQKSALLAKRFAVKEAASKALGTGVGDGVSWHDIYLEHDHLGAPILQFAGRAAKLAEAKGVVNRHVSVSDEDQYTLAFVVLSG